MAGIPLVFVLSAFGFFVYHVNQQPQNHQLGEQITTLYLGDSHVKVAVQDSLLPNSLNIADNSEPYYFSYYKLKTLLKYNSNIQRVYLGLGVHNFSGGYDRVVAGDKAASIIPRYFYLLPAEQQALLFLWNKDHLLPLAKAAIKQGKRIIEKGDYKAYRGGFSNDFVDRRAEETFMNKRLKKQFYENDKLFEFSDLNIQYLEKIILLCQKNNVQLIGLNTPLHPYYRQQVPVVYQEQFDDFLTKYNISVYDLSTLELPDEAYTPDGDHVSRLGALQLTPLLRKHAAALPATK